jgi:RimJ/RimL family protein N-acetyltransferase
MEKIALENLDLVVFDKNNLEHIRFLKSLTKDKTILARFQGIAKNLLHRYDNSFFGNSFFVSCRNTEKLIGFVNVGNYNIEEQCVYLRYAIDINVRGQGYGKLLLNEVTNFIFSNYDNVKTTRLKIASDNKESIGTANSSGYKWYKYDFYIAYNPNLSNDYEPYFR